MTAPAATPTQLPAPPDGSDAWTVLVYAHTHWDREWYQPFQRFRMQLVAAVDRILDTLDARADFTTYVLDGQTIVLDDYLAVRPERREQLERLVRAGRLEVGPWYILPDEFLVSGESLVRNLLEGRRGARGVGGGLDVGYLPDPFGHVAQLPQVLQGFGIGSVVFSRGMGDEFVELGSEFRWQAGGDSEVLALVQTGTYTNGYCNAEILAKAHDESGDEESRELARALTLHLAERARTGVLLLAAGCDHETVNPRLPDVISAVEQDLHGCEVRISGLGGVVDAIEASVERRAAAGSPLATWRGELRGSLHAPILAAIFSARIPLKQDNVRLQTRLERVVEPLAALANAARPGTVDLGFLREAWLLALQNQPHDTIGGCSVDATHLDMPTRTRQAEQICEGLEQDLLAAMGVVDVPHVFNPAAQVVSGVVDMPGEGPRFVGPLPPLGLLPLDEVSEPGMPGGPRVVDERTIASDHIQVRVHDGGRVEVESWGHDGEHVVLADALRYVDVADAGDEYDFGVVAGDRELVAELAGVEARMAGEGVAELRLVHRCELPAGLSADRGERSTDTVAHEIVTTMRIGGDLPWVECQTDFDNRALDHRLRVRTALGAPATRTLGDGHFAMTERPLRPTAPRGAWKQQPVPSNCCESCAVLPAADDAYGFALLGRGLHEYEGVLVAGDGPGGGDGASDGAAALELTLLRSVGWLSRDDIDGRPGHAGPALETPGAQCIGSHVAEWGILPFAGTWQDAGVAGLARRFAAPPALLDAIEPEFRLHSGQQARERDIAAAADLLDPAALVDHGISLDGIELSCVKPAADRSGDVIVRGFNLADEPVTAIVQAGAWVADATRVRLDEEPVGQLEGGSGVWRASVEPGGILTIRLEVGR